MNESRWAALLDRVRREYNAPPDTPREEMWAKIEHALPEFGDRSVPDGHGGHASWSWRHLGSLTAVASIAALLLLWLGFGIGRASAPGPSLPGVAIGPEGTSPPQIASVPANGGANTAVTTSTPDNAYSFAAARLLASTGTLLTQVEDQASSGVLGADAGAWARGLLTQTRLMLDLPGVADNGLRTLLEDLELILMQVVTVSGAQEAGDGEVGGFELEQLTNGLREGDVLPRIQRMLPPVLASDS